MISRTLSLFADFHQFYLQDEPAEGDLSSAWTAEAEARMLAVVPGTVGIGTARDVDVPVHIEIHATEPVWDLSGCDHVVDCAIAIESGSLVAAGCTDYFPEATRIPVLPGMYRVRACFSGLASVSPDGLEGEDSYRVVLWPGEYLAPVVVKQYAG